MKKSYPIFYDDLQPISNFGRMHLEGVQMYWYILYERDLDDVYVLYMDRNIGYEVYHRYRVRRCCNIKGVRVV
jgi:hypothetical protein